MQQAKFSPENDSDAGRHHSYARRPEQDQQDQRVFGNFSLGYRQRSVRGEMSFQQFPGSVRQPNITAQCTWAEGVDKEFWALKCLKKDDKILHEMSTFHPKYMVIQPTYLCRCPRDWFSFSYRRETPFSHRFLSNLCTWTWMLTLFKPVLRVLSVVSHENSTLFLREFGREFS